MKQSLVSIITPVFNAAPFLAAAIESVLAQSYPAWELLLVDDGSTDGSLAIAQEYARRYPTQIRSYTHPGQVNCGKSSSRNLGIEQAQGEYVIFLDADDVLLPDKVARQVGALRAHPHARLCYGRARYWHSWNLQSSGRVNTRTPNDTVSRIGVAPHRVYAPPQLLTRFLRDSGTVPCLCSLLVERTLIEEVGSFDEQIQDLYEDQVLIAKLFLHAPALVEDAVGELYRQHAASTSYVAQRSGDYHPWLPDPARRRYLQWLSEYLAARQWMDATLAAALHRALEPYRAPYRTLLLLPVRYVGAALLGLIDTLASRIRAATGTSINEH